MNQNVNSSYNMSITIEKNSNLLLKEDKLARITMGFVRRFLDSLNVCLQNQVALKKRQWTLSGALFCLYCGQFESNFTDFFKHLTITHRFVCSHCQARFSEQEQLVIHQALHREINKTETEPVSCEKDYKSQISQPIQIKIIKQQKRCTDAKKFRCDLCPFSYTRRVYLDYHKKQSHSQTNDSTKENKRKEDQSKSNENYLFEDNNDDLSSSQVETNLNTEDKPKGVLFPCPYCDFVGSRKRNLAAHKGKMHRALLKKRSNQVVPRIVDPLLESSRKYLNGVLTYECQVCGETRHNSGEFRRHSLKHSSERHFTCHHCGNQYRTLDYLKRHLDSVHQKIKRYNCDICGRAFAEKKACSDHRRTHTGEKPFVCEICGKAFVSHTGIYCHRRIHLDYRPHQCTMCDKRFRTKQRLDDHLRVHTGERPYACPICPKAFRDKSKLSRHSITHSVERPYVCDECGASFAAKRYLKQHSRNHTTLNDADSESLVTQVELSSLSAL